MIDPRLPQFVITGGRVRAGDDLPLETPIQTTRGFAIPQAATPEYREILRCCSKPQTVVDLSSQLGAPVGVLRVLVLDLADQGVVRLHGRSADDTADPDAPRVAPHQDIALLQETLRGISNL